MIEKIGRSKQQWSLRTNRWALVAVAMSLCLATCSICITPIYAQTKPAAVKSVSSHASPAISGHKSPIIGAHPAITLKVFRTTEGLPLAVAQMREHILSAVSSGRIEDLRLAIEWNELSPVFDNNDGSDPISYFKSLSADGTGAPILLQLGKILNAGYVKLPLGNDIENNLIYVWPYFAQIPLQQLTQAQRKELQQMTSPTDYAQMLNQGSYSGYKLAIGADGTWHEFVKGQ